MMKGFFFFTAIVLAMNLAAQLVPNSGFEQWTDQYPDQWFTNSCPQCDPPWESYIVRQDTDAFSGNYSANLYSNGVFKPFAYTTFPVAGRPLKLRFQSKVLFPACINTGSTTDTVMAKVEIFYNGLVVDSGMWSYSGQNIQTYQPIEVPLSITSFSFDSCRIYFEGGAVFGGCGIIAEATKFKVDAVEMIYAPSCNAFFYFSKEVDSVSFSGTSTHASVTNWFWDFDDGTGSPLQAPQHVFSQDRWYNVCLTVTGLDSSGTNCTTTFCDSVFITHDCIDSSLICLPFSGSLCCDAPLFEPVCGCDSVTYGNACQATLWYGVTKFTEGPCMTSLKEIKQNIKVSLIPNPAMEKTKLSFDLHAQGTIIVKVKNSIGATINESTHELADDKRYVQEIDFGKLRRGIYFIEISLNGKRIAVKKLVAE